MTRRRVLVLIVILVITAVVSRRLLIGGGGQAFIAPAGTITALTAAPDGAWSHQQDPRALYLAAVGKTVFTYVDGTSGDTEIASYDHASGLTTRTVLKTAVGGIEGSPDHHDNAAILRRASDGKLLAVYSPHSAAPVYRRISSNPDDATSWAAEANLDASIGGTDYTYPYLTQLVDEASDPIYLFIRDASTTPSMSLIFSKSTDGGATWSAKTTLYVGTSYWKIVSNGTDRVDIFAADGSMPTFEPPGTVGHFYMTGGSFFRSDGTAMGSPPFDASDLATVYDASDGAAWPFDAVLGPDGDPRVVVQVDENDDGLDNIYREFRFDGSAWSGFDIARSDGIWVRNISPGIVYDHADPRTLYATRKIGGRWELWRYRTPAAGPGAGVSWEGIPITSSSAADNLTPSPVFGHNGELPVVWFYGPYTDYLTYSTGIEGLVF